VALLVIEGAGAPAAAPALTLPIAHLDKLLHAAAHGWITLLLVWGMALIRRPVSAPRPGRVAALAAGLDSLVGLGIELVQLRLGAPHGRVFDLWDLAANLCGSALAAGLFLAVAVAALRAYTGADSRPETHPPAVS
jgi:hypothetical protein